MFGADTHGLQTWEEAPPPFRFSPVETEYVPMQTTITAKLKLVTTPEQYATLRQVQLAYRDALNQASQYAFAHGKTSNSQRVHQALYDEVRATHGLPSQMACSVFRQVAATRHRTLDEMVEERRSAQGRLDPETLQRAGQAAPLRFAHGDLRLWTRLHRSSPLVR